MVIITKKNTKPRHDNDLYETPYDLAVKIMDQFAPYECNHVLDPGCGRGVFGKAVAAIHPEATIVGVDTVLHAGIGDIYDRFFLTDYRVVGNGFLDCKFDLIIGNPPYSDAEKFIRNSMMYLSESKYSRIVFLLKIAFLNSVKRGRGLFKYYPPNIVAPLMQRPSFDGTGHTNDYDFAVYVWQPYFKVEKPVIEWIDWR